MDYRLYLLFGEFRHGLQNSQVRLRWCFAGHLPTVRQRWREMPVPIICLHEQSIPFIFPETSNTKVPDRGELGSDENLAPWRQQEHRILHQQWEASWLQARVQGRIEQGPCCDKVEYGDWFAKSFFSDRHEWRKVMHHVRRYHQWRHNSVFWAEYLHWWWIFLWTSKPMPLLWRKFRIKLWLVPSHVFRWVMSSHQFFAGPSLVIPRSDPAVAKPATSGSDSGTLADFRSLLYIAALSNKEHNHRRHKRYKNLPLRRLAVL